MSGYNTSGLLFNSSICFNDAERSGFTSPIPLCTVENAQVYSVSSIYSDNWNQYTAAGAGILGLGYNSSVWQLIGNPTNRNFAIWLSNFTDYSWYSSNYNPTYDPTLNFGGLDTYYYSSGTPSISINS